MARTRTATVERITHLTGFGGLMRGASAVGDSAIARAFQRSSPPDRGLSQPVRRIALVVDQWGVVMWAFSVAAGRTCGRSLRPSVV
jgi:hypothetical protein